MRDTPPTISSEVDHQKSLTFLEERKLVKRWSGPWSALSCLVFTLILFAITWWVFQDPRGVMRFYTPYVGYNYCRWWLIVLIWMAYIFDFWPFQRGWLKRAHPLQKGLVLSLISVAIMILMIHGFFQSVLGNTAFAYFNPQQLLKLKGLTDFYATEYAAQACMMFAVIASWISPAWISMSISRFAVNSPNRFVSFSARKIGSTRRSSCFIISAHYRSQHDFHADQAG